MVSKYTLGLKLSNFNLELSKAEALLCFKAYFETEELFCVGNICFFSVRSNPTDILSCLNRLAFTKEAFVVSDEKDWPSFLAGFAKDFELIHGKDSRFKVYLPLSPDNDKMSFINNIASVVLDKGLSGKISLSSPDLVVCGFDELEFRGLLVWTNKDIHRSRRTHLKPAPHPSGIDPRIAKAMINLGSCKNEVLDPFCGAGGILEEVKLLGLDYLGVDISWKMINLARVNLNSKEGLFCTDALTWDREVECVVTDLPYGKNSKLDGSLVNLIDGFFKHFSVLTKRIVVCAPNSYDLVSPANDTGWVLLHKFEVYVHGSLTRRIHVFETS